MKVSRRGVLLGMSCAGMAIPVSGRTDELPFQVAPYPDPAVEVLDPSFAKYRQGLAGLERLYTGGRFTEGPTWFGDGRYLLFTDIPNNRILRWDEITEQVTRFREPSNYANGMTRDRMGRLVICEHLMRRVVRIEHDGTTTVLADRFEGKRLNSPNDVIIKSDDSIWFTDPPFGISGYYQGAKAESELPGRFYRIDGATGTVSLGANDVVNPNGLAFSPDEELFYVGEGSPAGIRVYDVHDNGRTLANKRTLYETRASEAPDGIRVDMDGNLWCAWGVGPELNGVRVLNPQGKPIGHIHLPERCGNVAFGGLYRNRLFMAAGRSLYSIYVNAQGVPR